MLNKLQAVVNKFEELCFKSEQPDFYADPKKAAKLLREKNDLEPIVEAFQAYKQAEQDMLDAEELMSDPEMKELCQETYTAAKEQKEETKACHQGCVQTQRQQHAAQEKHQRRGGDQKTGAPVGDDIKLHGTPLQQKAGRGDS